MSPNEVFYRQLIFSGRLEIKAFVKFKVGLPNKTAGVIFTPVPCEVVYFEPERAGVQLLRETVGSGKSPIKSDFEHLERCGVWCVVCVCAWSVGGGVVCGWGVCGRFGPYTEVAFVEELFCTQTVHLGPGLYISFLQGGHLIYCTCSSIVDIA